MASIYACVSDLMLASRVSESLKAAGHEVKVGAELPNPDEASSFSLVVCDMDTADAEALAALTPPSLGFYSHVDVETRRRAVEAGVDLVVPRSRMARELPSLVDSLI